MALVKLSDALESFIGEYHLAEKLSGGDVLARWPEVVGEKIASIAEALRFENGELTVKVSSSVWRKELHMRTEEVLEKFEKLFPGLVKKITWR